MINEIPFTAQPNQTYTVNIAGEKQNLTFIINQSYNEQAGYWTINISNNANSLIVSNIPLFCNCDLLGQYEYLNIGHLFVVNIGDKTLEMPNSSNIADNFELAWVL